MDTLDFERLLNPISDDSPCGESLRWDPAWDELSQLRKTRKDPLDPSADTEADWRQVISLASELLASRTKDLLIAGWLTEALVRERGFAGFRDGLRLIHQLVERYWDGLFPLIEDGDLSLRGAPFTWLTAQDGGARMPAALREVGLARSANGVVYNWNFWHSRSAAPKGNDEELEDFERRVAEANAKKEEFDDAVEATSLEALRARYTELDESLQEISDLSTLIDERLGDQAPSWGDLKKTISDIQVFLRDVLKRRGGWEISESNDSGEIEAAAGGHSTGEGGIRIAGGALRSRADAVARLEDVARFFQAMDPHSPVAFLVRRAIRWANMSFEDLLAELVKDENTLKHVTETLGIGASDSGSPTSSE